MIHGQLHHLETCQKQQNQQVLVLKGFLIMKDKSRRMDTNDFSASPPENMLHIIPGEKKYSR